jgi:5-methylcytosine-specific restriction endonuclease McrA
MSEHSDEYRDYLRSDRWRAIRDWAFALHGRKCQECGETGGLEVHHLHYDTLGRERPEDLRVLCWRCHEGADRTRADEARQRSEEALYRARLDGWASKKYGEDWGESGDAEEIEEEFDDWLEDRGDE